VALKGWPAGNTEVRGGAPTKQDMRGSQLSLADKRCIVLEACPRPLLFSVKQQWVAASNSDCYSRLPKSLHYFHRMAFRRITGHMLHKEGYR